MNGKPCYGFRFVLYGDVETQRIPFEPIVGTLVRANTIVLLPQPENGAIVHYLPVVVTPDGIAHSINTDLGNVSGNQAI